MRNHVDHWQLELVKNPQLLQTRQPTQARGQRCHCTYRERMIKPIVIFTAKDFHLYYIDE